MLVLPLEEVAGVLTKPPERLACELTCHETKHLNEWFLNKEPVQPLWIKEHYHKYR